jgi:hypothetical protein
METRQRLAESIIPPWTEQWSTRRQLGFGLVACIPLTLLAATFLSWFLAAVGVGVPYTEDAGAVLLYTHVGAEFITLLIFGHLMIANPQLGGGAKTVWAAAFLFLAPFAIPTYWAMHVWHEEASLPAEMERQRSQHTVHVYDYDYETHQKGLERRDDGSIVHHVDVEAT